MMNIVMISRSNLLNTLCLQIWYRSLALSHLYLILSSNKTVNCIGWQQRPTVQNFTRRLYCKLSHVYIVSNQPGLILYMHYSTCSLHSAKHKHHSWYSWRKYIKSTCDISIMKVELCRSNIRRILYFIWHATGAVSHISYYIQYSPKPILLALIRVWEYMLHIISENPSQLMASIERIPIVICTTNLYV